MTQDTLFNLNPYTHEEVPWIATGWEIEGPLTTTITLDSEDRYNGIPAATQVEITDGMKTTFNLRTDVYWHDGNQYTPNDAEFALEFMRNNEIPRYLGGWENIADVQVINSTAFTVYSYETSAFYLADWSSDAPMLPPQVWSWLDGADLQTILGYEVWLNTTDTGPVSTPTQLFGTGPYVFGGYDVVGGVADLYRNDAYFIDTTEVGDMIEEMFHRIGDTNSDGEMDATDLSAMSLSFGKRLGQPGYDPLADVNGDGIVDATDVTLLSFYWGVPREYGS
jgi:ABC-type transport system substrate-binding protein